MPFYAYCRHHVDSARARLKRRRRSPSRRQMNIYGISFSLLVREKFDLWLRHRFEGERKNEKHRGNLAVSVREPFAFDIFAVGPTIIGGTSLEKESFERAGAPPFCSPLDSPIAPTARAFTSRRKDEEERERKRGDDRSAGFTEAFVLRFSGGWLPAFDGNAGRESLCDKLCNYGGGSVGSGRLVNRPGNNFSATLAFIKRI